MYGYGFDDDRLRRKALEEALEKARGHFTRNAELQQNNQRTAQALNNYVELISRSVDELEWRMNSLKEYYPAAQAKKAGKSAYFRQPRSSGALEEYYYREAIKEHTYLPAADRKELNEKANTLWQALKQLDNTHKALEVYARLKEYETDNFRESDRLLAQFPAQFRTFRKAATELYTLVQTVYRRTDIFQENSAYQRAAAAMQHVMTGEQQLMDTWSLNLAEDIPGSWPLDAFQQRVAAAEPQLPEFKKEPAGIEYPASAMYTGFGNALESLQQVRRRAIDDYTHQARQSDRHGNQVYEYLLNYYNNDMRVMFNEFVNHARQQGQYLLQAPKYCPALDIRTQAPPVAKTGITPPFRDIPVPKLSVSAQQMPVPAAVSGLFNYYVDYINESVRTVMRQQLAIRNYRQTVAYQKEKDPLTLQKQGPIPYTAEEFKIPLSLYQQVMHGSPELPEACRPALTTQAEVLLNVLREMDALNIELAGYTAGKQYLTDSFRRSDEIIQRYLVLFELFDQKKERLYSDVRRVFDAYPAAEAANSWYVSGKALRQVFELDREALGGLKAYLAGKTKAFPLTENLNAETRQLLAKEYENLDGIKRIGRNNGLCPYTPYEDLAENSRQFAADVRKVSQQLSLKPESTYERFVYYYNNQLVPSYNKFCELSPLPLLKGILQPFHLMESTEVPRQSLPDEVARTAQPTVPPAVIPAQSGAEPVAPVIPADESPAAGAQTRTHSRDTVFIEKTRVDTVYVPMNTGGEETESMDGYAYNNLILLLDVSGSMNAPHKLPLLKKSVKRLLQMLRPEDEVALIVYSGKARVLLEPTPGNQVDKISQAIDHLKSEGGTDGNAGLKMAYKLADRNYKRGGNNRIILATDGEFPINASVYELVEKNARQDIFLTVFHYNHKDTVVNNLQRLAERGKGRFERITPENSDLFLIREAKSRRMR
jgi:Ca-activated chloride channel homolog